MSKVFMGFVSKGFLATSFLSGCCAMMKIAIEGCAHGELDIIYDTLVRVMETERIKIDLLICCGDFQCPRNEVDMRCMSMPEKFLSMGSFYKYYSGEKLAPVPTLFIHGNHECVNYLKELYMGGWVAPNIYYLGYSGVVYFGGLRIGGLSGIFSEFDYRKGHMERPPYRGGSSKSSYHVREYEVFKMSQLTGDMDICLSHDWPRGIYHFGNIPSLLSKKPFFSSEIQRNELGSIAAQHLLLTLKPKYWFSAHLHVKFPALINHVFHPPNHDPTTDTSNQAPSSSLNPDASKKADEPQNQGTEINSKVTRFLALDKCLPGRDFLQILDIEPNDPQHPSATRDAEGNLQWFYDPEWIAILRASMPLYSTGMQQSPLPAKLNIEGHMEALESKRQALRIPFNFQRTFPAYDPSKPPTQHHLQSQPRMAGPFENPQTTALCEAFDIPLPSFGIQNHDLNIDALEGPQPTEGLALNNGAANPDEIMLDEDDDDVDGDLD